MDKTKTDLKVITWNVSGIRNRFTDIHCYVFKHSVDIVLLQETEDRDDDSFQLNGYVKYQLQAQQGIRGVTTYVKKSLPSVLLEPPCKVEGIETVSMKVTTEGGDLNVANIYSKLSL